MASRREAPAFGIAVAGVGGGAGEFVDGGVEGADDFGGDGFGGVADAEADDFRVGVLGGELAGAAGDFGEEVAGGQLAVG
jgi:hypothetical protein